MENIDKSKTGSLFKFVAWVSLVLLVVTLWCFANLTAADQANAETRYSPRKFFMLLMVFVSFLLFLKNNTRKIKNNSFLWFAVFYAFVALFSTLISGLYTIEKIPFMFVSMSYWVSVLIISYYSVLHLNTLKFHVFIVGVFLPVLFFVFFVMMTTNQRYYGDGNPLNEVYYLAYLLPVVLLMRKNSLKLSGVLLIFVATLLSYKRALLLAFLTSVPVYLYARNAISTSGKIKKLTIIIFGCAFAFLLLAFTFNYISSSLGLDWTTRMEDLSDGQGAGRMRKYIGYMNLFFSQSFFEWIIGHGYMATAKTKFNWSHNDIIEVLYDFGLLGLMFYLLFIGQLAKLFFEMKKYKYIHFDAFAVSLVFFLWETMFSMFIVLPYWFLDLAFFWGWVIADFHNAKRFRDPARITT